MWRLVFLVALVSAFCVCNYGSNLCGDGTELAQDICACTCHPNATRVLDLKNNGLLVLSPDAMSGLRQVCINATDMFIADGSCLPTPMGCQSYSCPMPCSPWCSCPIPIQDQEISCTEVTDRELLDGLPFWIKDRINVRVL